MKTRKALQLVTSLMLVVALVLATAPFMASMNPNDVVKERAKVRIKLSEIHENRALEVDLRWSKAFIVKNPEITVFIVPYYDGAIRLPDPEWGAPSRPCKKFVSNENGFSCQDTSLEQGFKAQATWDLKGNNLGSWSWMPDLRKTDSFIIEDGYLVLSPEYD